MGAISCPFDVLAFEKVDSGAGILSGINHFGFRLVATDDLDQALVEVESAGGTVLRRGEFAPGFPCAYVADPDGYELEIWFE